MKIAIALVTVLALGQAMPQSDPDAVEWENYKQEFHKFYESDEIDQLRRSIYYQHKEKIEIHNKRYREGLFSYSMKLNQFSDELPSEASARHGLKYSGGSNILGQPYQATHGPLPTSVDWRTRGVVTRVKDQADCGSCWAFSTTGSLEGQMAIKTGKLVSLSEQQLVDCADADGNDGCNGGFVPTAFRYIQKNPGIQTEKSYPYTQKDGICSFNKVDVAAYVTGFVYTDCYNETDLQNAVANVGPVSVAINAKILKEYHGGLFDHPECTAAELDHGVLVVGYGVENGTDYWLVKNSWGPSWGEAGYFRIARNKNNQCGIASGAVYPLVL